MTGKSAKTLIEVVGDNVTALMKRKGLTEESVATAAQAHGIKINQTSVGRVARKSYATKLDTLDGIAHGLGVPAWQLLYPGGVDEGLGQVLTSYSRSGDVGKELIRIAALGALHRDNGISALQFFDEKLVEILKAWAQSNGTGRNLLQIAAAGALTATKNDSQGETRRDAEIVVAGKRR